MSVNIKQADGLKRLSQTIEFYKSSSSISIPQLFTGSYNDLTDKPIVDGNATIESIETTQSSFYVQDGSGNTIALIDDQGVHSIDFYANGESVKQHMSSSIDQLNDLSGSLDTHKANSTIHITSEEREKWNDPLSDEGDTLYINDALGNTIAIFDAKGLTTTNVTIKFNGEALEISSKLTEIDNSLTSIQNKNNDQDGRLDGLETATEKLEFIDASELDDTFSIVDTHGNPVAQFDASGLTTTEVTIADSKGSPIQVGAKIENIESRVSTAEGEIDTLQDQLQTLGNNFNSHTDDTTVHITASERSTWNTVTSKANQSDLNTTNQNLATEVTNRQNADQVLQGNIDTEAQTRANEDAAINERTAEIEASENGVLSITDPSGNAIAQFDENGLLVTAIQTAGNVTVGGNITTAGNFDSKELSADKVISRGDIEAQGEVKGATITATGNVSAADVKTGSIDSLNSTISTINNNASALEGRVSTAEGEIDTLQSQVSTLIASDSGKSVRTIANEELAAALIPSDAQESLNTLQEIADWIQDHPEDAAAMNSKIEANTAAINNHINEVEPRFNALEEKTANIEDSAESDAFTIYDKNNQPGFQVDASGTTVHTLKADNATVVNKISAGSMSVGGVADVENKLTNIDGAIQDLAEDLQGLDNDLRPNSHNHNNKSLLDAYDQTNDNIKNAVDKAHSHNNKTVLDNTTASFTAEEKTKLGALPSKSELDGLFNNKQDNLTAGDYIDITNNTVSVKDLPYSELKDIPADIVHDENYIHTDNNFTTAYKTQLDGISTTYATKGELTDHQNNAEATYRKINDSYSKTEVDAKIPTVNNATLTIQKNGEEVVTFTANSASNATANITVPTKVTDLSDASDYALATRLNDYRTINDSYSKTEVDAKIPTDFYSKTEADNKFALAPEEGEYALYKEGTWQEEPAIAVIAAGGVGSNNNDTRISDLVLKNDIVNNLTSDLTNVPLSAAQGKALKTAIDNIGDIAAGAGNGDMLKTVYDTNNNGKVDHAEYSDTANIADNASKLGGKEASEYALASSLNDYQPQTLSTPLNGITTVEDAISAIYSTANQTSSGLGGITNGSISVPKATADKNGDQIDTTYVKQSQLTDYALTSSLNNYALVSSLNDYRTISDSYSKTEVDGLLQNLPSDDTNTTYTFTNSGSSLTIKPSEGEATTLDLSTDLSNYYTKDQTYSKDEVNNELQEYATEGYVDGEVTTQLSEALASYYTKSQVYNKTEIDAMLSSGGGGGGSDDPVVITANSFVNMVVGKTTISATSSIDTLIFEAGSNITLGANAENKKITIRACAGGPAEGDWQYPLIVQHPMYQSNDNFYTAIHATYDKNGVITANGFESGSYGISAAGIDPSAANGESVIQFDMQYDQYDTTSEGAWIINSALNVTNEIYENNQRVASRTWVSNQLNNYILLQDMYFVSYHQNTTSPLQYTLGGPSPEQSTAMQLVYAQGSDDNFGFFYMPSDKIDADQNPDPSYQIANLYTISNALSQYVSKTSIGYHTDSNLNIEFSIGSNIASPNKSLIYRQNADGEGSFYYEPNEEISQELNEDAEIATIGDINAVKGQLEEYIKVFTIDYPGGLDLFYQNNYTLTGSLPNNMTAASLIEQGYNIICFVDGDLRIQFTMSQMTDEGMMMGYAPVPNLVRALSPQYISADIVVADSGYTIMLSKGQSIQLDLTLGNGYVTNVETLNVVRNLYNTYGLVSLRVNNAVTFVPVVCYDYGTNGLLGFITDEDIIKYTWTYNVGGSTQVTPTIKHITTEDSLTTILSSYADIDYVDQEIDTAIWNYYTKAEVDSKISNSGTNIDLSNQEVDGNSWKIVDNANNTIAQIDKNGLTVSKINVASNTDNFVKTFRFGDDIQELDNYKKVIRRIHTDVPNQNDWGALYEYFRQDIFQMTESIGPDSCVGYFVKAYANAVLPTNLEHYLCAMTNIINLDSFKVEMLGSYGSAAECTMTISIFTRTAETYKLQICSKHNSDGGYSASGWYKEGAAIKSLDLSGRIEKLWSNEQFMATETEAREIRAAERIIVSNTSEWVVLNKAATTYSNTNNMMVHFVGSMFNDNLFEYKVVLRIAPDNSVDFRNAIND